MIVVETAAVANLGAGPGDLPSLVLGKKRRNDRREKSQQGMHVNQHCSSPPHPHPLAQSLDPPLCSGSVYWSSVFIIAVFLCRLFASPMYCLSGLLQRRQCTMYIRFLVSFRVEVDTIMNSSHYVLW